MTVRIAIVYHSGYGHTAKVAEYIAQGAKSFEGAVVDMINCESFTPDNWETLDSADAIIFGAPTYMGGVSAPFKTFMDSTSKQWLDQRWKDKIAGAFTNSGAFCGDKLSTLQQIMIFTMQHGMIWVGNAQKIESKTKGEPGPDAINRLGSYIGVMTFATNDSPVITPPPGDLETARRYGLRIAQIAVQFQ